MITKADCTIWIMCSYKKVNEKLVIPVLALPTVDGLLSHVGRAHVFNTIDLVRGFSQCSIHEGFIPLTAVVYAIRKLGVDGHADGACVKPRVVSVDHVSSVRGSGTSAVIC